jgi:pimeloyl-ACP methyl ester carboxylesterase
MSVGTQFTRRCLLKGGTATGFMLLSSSSVWAAATPDLMPTVPIAGQVPVTEGLATLPDTRLWYWDTGGDGQPVVLVHPASASSEAWIYQRSGLAAAGHRVIAYSRRGYFKSDPVPDMNPGQEATDLLNLLDFLGVQRCHLVGSAAGCQVSLDFALSFPSRLYSLTFASGTGGIRDEDYREAMARLRQPGLDDLPSEFRELSQAFREANPQGTARWKALTEAAVTGNRLGQTNLNQIDWAALEQMSVPTLLTTGEADLVMPPALFDMIADHLPNAEVTILPQAGHTVFWEQPESFNQMVLEFISRHRS